MKATTVYRSDDGHDFRTGHDCLVYEGMLESLQSAARLLREPIDEECHFSNGGGFVQQVPEALARFDEHFEDILRTYLTDEVADKYKACPRGIVGRYLSDGGGPLYDAAYRLWCRRYAMDDHGREWGQPYYAFNPSKGKQEPWPKVKEATTKTL